MNQDVNGPIDPAGVYSITITGLRDESVREDVALYIASIMRGKTAGEIKASLENLPFLLTRSVSGGVAQKLKDRLHERGVTLDIVPLSSSARGAPPYPITGAPSPEGARGGEVSPLSAASPVPAPVSIPEAHTLPSDDAVEAGLHLATFPWEDREEHGFYSALWRTFTGVMFSPSEFYSTMPAKGKVGPALLYAVLFGVLGIVLSAPTLFLTRLSFFRNLPMTSEDLYPILLGAYTFTVFFSPLFIVLGYFLLALLFHVCVLLVGGTGGFEATLKVMAYSSSASVFRVFPFLGSVVFAVYSLGLWSIGFQKVHGLSSGRAAISVLLPLIVIGVLGVLIVTLTILAVGASVLQNLLAPVRG